MEKTRTEKIIARFITCAIIAETLLQIVSGWTNVNGLMMANKSFIVSEEAERVINRAANLTAGK
jgi:hypothetical protein